MPKLTIRETAAVENSSIYWSLLDSLSNSALSGHATDQDYYNQVLELLRKGSFQDPVTLSSFELGLSLHIAAPKIEAYYQFYNTSVLPSLEDKYDESCEAWILWGGRQICNPNDLETTLSQKILLPYHPSMLWLMIGE